MSRIDALEAFVKAMRARDLVTASQLLVHDPDIIAMRTPEGASALMVAAYMRAEPFIDMLLGRGAHVDVHEAAAIGMTDQMRALIAVDPSRLESHSADGWTPLHLAAHLGRVETMEALFELGASTATLSTNPLRNTPLHAAAAGKQAEAAGMLLAAGADVDARASGDHTALHIAAAGGATDVIDVLLAAGAHIDAKSDAGHTPHDLAVQRAQHEAARRITQARDGAA